MQSIDDDLKQAGVFRKLAAKKDLSAAAAKRFKAAAIRLDNRASKRADGTARPRSAKRTPNLLR